MKKLKILRIEIHTFGSIFSKYLEMETHKLDIHYDSEKKVFFVNLENFEFTPPLDIWFRCKGRNGATSQISIFIDGNVDPFKKYSCTVERGIGEIKKSLDIN